MSLDFDKAANYYDITRGLPPHAIDQIFRTIVEQTKITRQSKVLEIGIGTGRISYPFIIAGYNITGIDISRRMLAVLKEKLLSNVSQEGLRCHICLADVISLPLRRQTFDLVIAYHLLHLVNDWMRVVREVQDVLLPSGRLIIGDELVVEGMQSESINLEVRNAWAEICRALGAVVSDSTDTGVRSYQPDLVGFLHAREATVKEVVLANFKKSTTSPQELVERYRNRLYSSKEDLPDEIHAEAMRRLDKWLKQRFADPDEKSCCMVQSRALIVSWE